MAIYSLVTKKIEQTESNNILKKSYTMTKWALSQECKDSLISENQSMYYTTLTNWKLKTIWLSQ